MRRVEFKSGNEKLYGFFHKWIKNNQSVFALVEDSNGYMHYVHHKHVRFVCQPVLDRHERKVPIPKQDSEMDYPPF